MGGEARLAYMLRTAVVWSLASDSGKKGCASKVEPEAFLPLIIVRKPRKGVTW